MSRRYLGQVFRKGTGKDATGRPTRATENRLLGKLEEEAELHDQPFVRRKIRRRGGTIFEGSIDYNFDPPVYRSKISGGVIGGASVLSHMDSGFVLPEETEGYIWQTPYTRGLYENYESPGLGIVPGPVDYFDSGEVPPSFTPNDPEDSEYADKLSEIEASRPGDYTGKLKWLLAGQLGLKCNDPYWVDRDDFRRDKPAVGRLSGEGIFTDEDGNYWYLEIEYSGGFSGTATLLESTYFDGVDLSGITRDGSDFQRQVETHILSTVTKTATVWNITFTGDTVPATSLPFAFGWHFNREGGEATLISHIEDFDFIPDDPLPHFAYWYDGYKSVATITKEEPVGDTPYFKFDIAVTSLGRWDLHEYTVLWKPTYSVLDVPQSTPRYAGYTDPAGYNEIETTIYAYYDADDVLQEVKYAYDRVDGSSFTDNPCPDSSIYNERTLEAYRSYSIAPKVTQTILVGDESTASVSGGGAGGLIDTYFSYGLATTPQIDTEIICNLGAAISASGWAGSCAADGYVQYSDSCNPIGCQPTRHHTWEYLTGYTWYRKTAGNPGPQSRLAIVFSHGCAQGVVVLKEKIDGAYYSEVTLTDGGGCAAPTGQNPSACTYSVIAGITYNQCEGYPTACEKAGQTVILPKVIMGAGPLTSSSSTTKQWIDYELNVDMMVAHIHGVDHKHLYDEPTDFVGNTTGLYGKWFWSAPYPYDTLPTTTVGYDVMVSLTQGGTPAYRVYDGVSYHNEESWPEAAEIPIGWA